MTTPITTPSLDVQQATDQLAEQRADRDRLLAAKTTLEQQRAPDWRTVADPHDRDRAWERQQERAASLKALAASLAHAEAQIAEAEQQIARLGAGETV